MDRTVTAWAGFVFAGVFMVFDCATDAPLGLYHACAPFLCKTPFYSVAVALRLQCGAKLLLTELDAEKCRARVCREINVVLRVAKGLLDSLPVHSVG